MNNRILPMAEIFFEAISLPKKHFRMLLKVGLPLIVIYGLAIVFFNVFSGTEKLTSNKIIVTCVTILFYVTLVMAIIGCHRLFLLDSNTAVSSGLFNWTSNEIKYAGWSVLIIGAMLLIALPFTFLFGSLITPLNNIFGSGAGSTILVLFLKIGISYIASRWSLVLPSSAIDKHGKSLFWSWRLSEGNGWRLTILIAGLPFLFNTLLGLFPLDDSVFASLFLAMVWLVIGVIQVGLLSLSYKFLVSEEADLKGSYLEL